MIQIFGTKKNADARKAERFFKERGVKYQYVDLAEKGLSKGELQAVMQACGGPDALLDPNAKDKDLYTLIAYLAPEQKLQKVLENQQVLRQPIVRCGKAAAVGNAPEAWKKMIETQNTGRK